MHSHVDAFIAEIKAAPKFIAAAACNSALLDGVGGIEWGLSGLSRASGNDPIALAYCDRIAAIIQSDGSMKQRLARLMDVLTEASKIFDVCPLR